MPATFAPSPTPAVVSSGLNDLFELSTGIGMAPGGYVAPKAVSNTTLCGQDLNYLMFNIDLKLEMLSVYVLFCSLEILSCLSALKSI